MADDARHMALIGLVREAIKLADEAGKDLIAIYLSHALDELSASSPD